MSFAADFYRADYAVERCSVYIRLSVCHTPVFCLNGYVSSNTFNRRVAPSFWFFPHQMEWQCSDGDPPNGGVECKGV